MKNKSQIKKLALNKLVVSKLTAFQGSKIIGGEEDKCASKGKDSCKGLSITKETEAC